MRSVLLSLLAADVEARSSAHAHTRHSSHATSEATVQMSSDGTTTTSLELLGLDAPSPSPSYEWELCVSAAFFTAGVVHGCAGFGAGMVSMAILPTRLPLLDATPVCAIFALLVALTMAVHLREALGSPKVRAALIALVAGAAIGVPIGGVLLLAADSRVLRFLLGACMLIFVCERMLHEVGWLDERTLKSPRSRAANHEAASTVLLDGVDSALRGLPRVVDHPFVAFGVGVASGILGGALNECGPPVVMFLALKGWSKDEQKACLQFYFLLVSLFSVTMLAHKGVLLPRHLYLDVVGLPAAAMGIGLGVACYSQIDHKLFGRIVVFALLVAGTVYVVHASSQLIDEVAGRRRSIFEDWAVIGTNAGGARTAHEDA